ncbi:MAG: SCP2 sterol-binding domain-containing protein [Xanthobacteraceae bacterium]|nr:SCP2 sterol-binding domain-containing protein [Xanthobacteraceae bacterium]
MSTLHPTIARLREVRPPAPPTILSAAWLKQLALDCGADDVGIVEVERPALADQRPYIHQVYPDTKVLLAFVKRTNPEPVRAVARSVSNQEFHAVYDEANDTARAIVTALREAHIPACNAVAAFPMEVQLPARGWLVAHKPVAVAAGLGHMGLHRSVIHPKFGSFVLLGTVLIGVDADAYDQPIDYNPCLECKLCVAACPVGAIKPDGGFDFLGCYTHNYRDFLGNFTDWVDAMVESKSMSAYRERFTDGETASIWQSLSFKPGYKAAYCIAVCPAGEDVANPFLEDRPGFVQRHVKPLTDKPETVYVLPGSDAEETVARRFPAKTAKRVRRATRLGSVRAFVGFLPLGFQRGRAKGVTATFHWTFTGSEQVETTVRIDRGKIAVRPGLHGEADVRVHADADTWIRVMNREYGMIPALILRKVRVKGSMALFRAFGRCFAS